MWKLLFTIFVISAASSPYSYADDSDYIELLNEYLSEAQYAIPKADDFEEKKHALIKLEKLMFALDERASKDASVSVTGAGSLSTIIVTLELVPMVDLEPDTCELYLAKIHVGFDPTTEINPRLPTGARQINNLVALACSIDIAERSADKTVTEQY